VKNLTAESGTIRLGYTGDPDVEELERLFGLPDPRNFAYRFIRLLKRIGE
jgi:hypothetical protein